VQLLNYLDFMVLQQNLTDFNRRIASESCPDWRPLCSAPQPSGAVFNCLQEQGINWDFMHGAATTITEFCLTTALPLALRLLPPAALPALLLLPTVGSALHCFLWL